MQGLILLGFLSLFHIIGGAVIGTTLRGLRGGLSCNTPFLLMWGVGFGGIPLMFGWMMFNQQGMLYLLIAQILVFVGAILLAALQPAWVFEPFKTPAVRMIGTGGICLIIGVTIGIATVQQEPMVALLFGGIFGGVGALVMANGVKTLFKM